MIRVVVADDQTVVREGVALLLGLTADIEVVAAAADGEAAVAAVVEHRPDVALLDLRMPRLGGAGAACRIREEAPGTRVVVLTTYADDLSIVTALRAGAVGYLTKDASGEEIERAVRDAAAGRTRLDPAVQARMVELVVAAPAEPPTSAAAQPLPRTPAGPGGALTERELEVLRLVAEGLANRAIAARLFVTEATVKTHINNVFAKLDVSDRAAAVAWAFRAGVVQG
jgi:DNA-binding NarL/FixJ family response regulator